ncbi:hypothetical protein RJ640_016203 [Escallonia rubra]|uniref:Uncharacterized protein n=1 Tax=Escallonia rubra TaxID=112253 RepID=A0AA88QNW4_9ASTE|nr:hypothetical protein RJ640_016203 [Escallonia rubra]
MIFCGSFGVHVLDKIHDALPFFLFVIMQEPLTDREIEELIAELLEVESKAAEAQEALEDESLAKVEIEVREELAQSLSGDDLEKAVVAEMAALKEEWEAVLDDHETESAHLLEQLDGAGIELPSLYKWIESEAPNGCCTEAWKKRTHWVGSQVTSDLTESVADAEKYLQIHRPVRRYALLPICYQAFFRANASFEVGNSFCGSGGMVKFQRREPVVFLVKDLLLMSAVQL